MPKCRQALLFWQINVRICQNLFQLDNHPLNFRTRLHEARNLLGTVTDRRVIPPVIEAANSCCCPAAYVLGQIHSDLPVEFRRLYFRVPGAGRRIGSPHKTNGRE